MTSPPPVLPPLRFLGIDLPSSPLALDHLAPLEGTSVPANTGMDNRTAVQPSQALPDIVPIPPALNPPDPPNAAAEQLPPIGVEDWTYDNPESDLDPDHESEDDDVDDEDDERDGDMDSEDDEHDDEHDVDNEPYPWRAIAEDTSLPCEDEQAFIDTKEEHSAKEHAYWEQETFFDLDDPSLPPVAQGRIEWNVIAFNGTKEKPNKQLVMKSPIVRIGDHDWQIKMFPHGDRTEFLSVYVECLTMSKSDFKDQVDFKHPPLPVMKGTPLVKRRVSVAAQVAVVMYNPAEPRVYEHKIDAHQFHKHSADFGWKYFSHEPRHEFHIRKHGQRQAILRNDKLSFTAYIRIVHDPTGCLWENIAPQEGRPTSTGLPSFDSMSPRLATYLLLFHLAPFRRWLYNLDIADSPTVFVLQSALQHFLDRRLARKYLRQQVPGGCDIVNVLHGLRGRLVKEVSKQVLSEFDAILGSLDATNTPIAHNRLLTSKSENIQQAIDTRSVVNDSPGVLTLELERQRFNKSKRKWEKVNNPVHLNDEIKYGSVKYTLYAFVTHSGALGSSQYVPHVRPGGPGELWYAYDSKFVKCLTSKAAEARQLGNKSAAKTQAQPFSRHHTPPPIKQEESGIAYLAMYVREDLCADAFSAPAEEVSRDPRLLPERLMDYARRSFHSTLDRPILSEVKSAHASAAPTAVPHMPGDLMDGDDVIMSDAEDNGPSQSYINRLLQGTSATNRQDVELQTIRKCTNYFAGPFFDGTALLDGRYHGRGRLISTNGDDYYGHFKYNKAEGNGTIIYGQSGDKYTGEWLEGQHHGHGTLIEKRTGNKYEGGWEHGRRRGSFTLTGKVTEDDKQFCQICCEREMNIAFYDCGHVLACKQCAAELHTCPICRKQIVARLELFGVKIGML
ncbi:hypothetical protein AMS68_004036 [Peltaster fructicola]|uniref:RING-type domain-containing protein n=1 Tax=Peltaster fructicola TaxID=286661 RepID=A0A6H0XV68_9PEZI|nr:hypothetical protein AMS68_004036 [Peltaster fructicola]